MRFWRPPFGLGKEDDIFKNMNDLTDLAHNCVEEMKNCVIAFSTQDFASVRTRSNACTKYEEDADVVRRKLERNLYSSGFLGFSREDKYQLAEKIDDIADQAQKAAEWLTLKKIKVDKETGELMIELAEKTLESTEALKRCVKSFELPLEKTFEEVDSLEIYREGVRIALHRIAEKLFNSEINPVTIQLLWEVAYRISRVADMAEEAGDRIGGLALKSVE
ncbi:MAG: DUF47 family protein [Candidatus Aenigmatarchaeota archaeon]